MFYDNSEKIEYKLEERIFLYYKKENHYNYLQPYIRLFKKKIKDFPNNEMGNNNLIVNEIQTGENQHNNKLKTIKDTLIDEIKENTFDFESK